ncbi:hypothetical protein GCM10009087_27240 [Sphingomonas oligophenolica]
MRAIAFLVGTPLLASCSHDSGNPAPPRVETAAELPRRSSTITVPVSARLADLEDGINRRTPRILWRIDKRAQLCVPPRRVKLFRKRLKVTPALHCDIAGEVTRGRITLSGSGATLLVTMPINATISAAHIGGIISKETATGAAIIRASARLAVDGNWSPTARVAIAYDWTDPPGIDFLGQRIRFAEKADSKLQGVIARLQRDLPRELDRLRLHDQLDGLWRQGFTSIMLNRERPPVWMRITPRSLGFGGYRIAGGRLEMDLAAEALTETFVGNRPSDPVPTPLPPPSRQLGERGLRFFIPVLADYAELEPVVERTLAKLAKKQIVLAGIGPVDATFGKVTIYATEHGRLAVGIHATVKSRNVSLVAAKGEVWLSAIPFNGPNSQFVQVRDLQIAAHTDSTGVNLLFSLFENGSVRDGIRGALAHDFVGDYQKVLTAARGAISVRRQGDFVLSANVASVEHGPIQVTGKGLFMPVEAQGEARIQYRPR